MNKVIRSEGFSPGEINIIITSDRKLKEINKKFLQRAYFTDIITFDYSDGRNINGEMYLSIDAIRRNRREYKSRMQDELDRVMIHGILHMTGEKDHTKKEKEKMRKAEEKYLAMR